MVQMILLSQPLIVGRRIGCVIKRRNCAFGRRQEKFIQNLQNALIRIENKTYGIVVQQVKLISKERLKSVHMQHQL